VFKTLPIYQRIFDHFGITINVKIVNLIDNKYKIHDSQINAAPDTETLVKNCTVHKFENAFHMVVIIQQKMSEIDINKEADKTQGTVSRVYT